jgi:hypothetical protein
VQCIRPLEQDSEVINPLMPIVPKREHRVLSDFVKPYGINGLKNY